ncbi:MAG: surface carbohydrate biosynthesis protein [Bacteroidota bacterium]
MNILLPIETINREIDFKIVLAAQLAAAGHKIYIGQHDFLMSLLPELKGGLYIGKNIFHKRASVEDGSIYHLLKKHNFNIIYLHEEGAVYLGEEKDWKQVLNNQYNASFFDKEDAICVWGDFQKAHDVSRTQDILVTATGHPRFDLYKPEWNAYFDQELTNIKSSYNDYILINGNYGVYNHGIGVHYIFSDKASYQVDDVENRMRRVAFYTYSGIQCMYMIRLTHTLAIKFPQKNFIYRPHPSENHSYYKHIFNGVKNIHVVHDGPVAPWIIGAEAVIHDGCTTAIEAFIAGKPVINFKPFYDADADIWLPNQMGIRAKSIEEVEELLIDNANYKFDLNGLASKKRITDLFYNFENDSYEALIKVIDKKISESRISNFTTPSRSFIKNKYLKLRIRKKVALLVSQKKKKQYQYHSTKFYGFDREYLEGKFQLLENMLNKKISVQYHNPFLVVVE